MNMMQLSAYELERLETMKENAAELERLGLAETARQCRAAPPAVKAKRPPAKRPAKRAPAVPTRPRSSRLSGAPPAAPSLDEKELDALLSDKPSYHEAPKRASALPRLTPEQSTKLDALEPVVAGALTDRELRALDLAKRDMLLGRTEGGWRAHQAKGTSMWAEKRRLLREAAEKHGLRWPTWLGAIQRAVTMGNKEEAQNQTMFSIEKAACGLGLDYKNWPEGVGVLLANEELPEEETNEAPAEGSAPAGVSPATEGAVAKGSPKGTPLAAVSPGAQRMASPAIAAKAASAARSAKRAATSPPSGSAAKAAKLASPAAAAEPVADAPSGEAMDDEATLSAWRRGPTPRVLTLGSDTELLRREGQRLEHTFGRDAGNGWVYNHALGKLRAYQEILLRDRFGEEPSAPSVRELEEEEEA